MNEICRRAQKNDREALINLWMQAFGDASEEIERFLDLFDPAKTALVLCEDDTVCSMLFLLPAAVQDGDRRYKVGYIYAGATRSDKRGRGCYRRLLDYASQTAAQTGLSALLLRPATEQLADSYRRMGFTVPLYANARKRNETALVGTTTAAVYAARRREMLCGQAFVDWDDRVLEYAMTWCEACENGESLLLYDAQTVWECLPADTQTETALLMPLTKDFLTTTPIWFGYGLE